jgi:hypothetical protein
MSSRRWKNDVTIVKIGWRELPARSVWKCPLRQLPMGKNVKRCAVVDEGAQLSVQIMRVLGCGIDGDDCLRAKVGA